MKMRLTVIPIIVDALGTVHKGWEIRGKKKVWFGLFGFMAYQPL